MGNLREFDHFDHILERNMISWGCKTSMFHTEIMGHIYGKICGRWEMIPWGRKTSVFHLGSGKFPIGFPIGKWISYGNLWGIDGTWEMGFQKNIGFTLGS